LAGRVTVFSDVELAFEAAFSRDRPGRGVGVLLAAGTGSIAFGRDARGRAARAGGLGPGKGDEGSGHWIGREYLKAMTGGRFAAAGRTASVAALAERVIAQGRRKGISAEIVRRAQEALAALAAAVAGKLRFDGKVPLSWTGSLLEDRAFRTGVFRRLRRSGIRFAPVRPATAPAMAAARWAGRVSADPTRPFGHAVPPSR
jgi:N-acetylglucosamine kinase-like BadF-type ATPase